MLRRNLIMADVIGDFLQELEKGHQPLLGKVQGTVRFDLTDAEGATDHWLVSVNRGDITVSQKRRLRPSKADCAIHCDKELFEQLITGEENAIAATLRGALVCTGNVELLFAIQRIFPGPPRKRQQQGEAMASS
jgi:putative sterol carrier protein